MTKELKALFLANHCYIQDGQYQTYQWRYKYSVFIKPPPPTIQRIVAKIYLKSIPKKERNIALHLIKCYYPDKLQEAMDCIRKQDIAQLLKQMHKSLLLKKINVIKDVQAIIAEYTISEYEVVNDI